MKISSAPLNFSRAITQQELFNYFADQPWAMWLDSCNSEHVDSQFDIMVWQPQVTLVTRDDNTTITTYRADEILSPLVITESVNSTDDPLALIHQQQDQLFKNVTIEKNDLPFKTGAVGMFSYDLGRRFEKVSTQAEQDISLAEMSVGLYQKAIIFDHQQQQFHLVCADNQREGLVKRLQNMIELETNAKANAQAKPDFSLTSAWSANMTKAEYQKKFNRVQQALLDGDCYQVNLAQRFSATYTGNEFTAYKTLRKQNNAPFSAFIKLEQHSLLSVSPERFLQLSNNKVQSKPIKGTMPRMDDKAADEKNALILSQSEKDRSENLMIVDLLRNDISKTCQPGSVKVPKLFDIESFPAVHHMVSTVVGDLAQGFNATDLLRGAFPGGSITGAPKISAMEVIEALEPQRRSLYCGSIGYISACGNMDTSITIRTLICEKSSNNTDNKIYCWAGGGLVADSNVEAEYQETFDKVNKILPVLKIA